MVPRDQSFRFAEMDSSGKVRRSVVVVIVVESFIIAAPATYPAFSECSENKCCAFDGEVCGSC